MCRCHVCVNGHVCPSAKTKIYFNNVCSRLLQSLLNTYTEWDACQMSQQSHRRQIQIVILQLAFFELLSTLSPSIQTCWHFDGSFDQCVIQGHSQWCNIVSEKSSCCHIWCGILLSQKFYKKNVAEGFLKFYDGTSSLLLFLGQNQLISVSFNTFCKA